MITFGQTKTDNIYWIKTISRSTRSLSCNIIIFFVCRDFDMTDTSTHPHLNHISLSPFFLLNFYYRFIRLQVLIAQREFEQAVDLVRRGSEFCSAHSDSALVREARVRLEAKTKHLIEVLTEELRTDKSVQVKKSCQFFEGPL